MRDTPHFKRQKHFSIFTLRIEEIAVEMYHVIEPLPCQLNRELQSGFKKAVSLRYRDGKMGERERERERERGRDRERVVGRDNKKVCVLDGLR